ncbi:MAG: hypothetical protein KGZ69_11015 [Methylomonas sp.]|nr:hypothetical protein [Methylomonas sp.]
MEHFVTLFDSLFLPQGLALHRSMQRHIKDYCLWVLCMDDETHQALSKLNPPNVRLLELSKLETEALLAVKPKRTKGEYCWTLTPFTPKFVFEADSTVERVTYLDADLWFRKNPAPIFAEFDASRKHVLITDHAYAAEHDQSATSGQYCVQFMTFTRTGGELVRQWWEQKCVEWCFARFEEGKFGDQKYLDDWTERFPLQVHVLQNKELLLAPWNATRFPYGNSVAWHFHALRVLIAKNQAIYVEFGPYLLPKYTLEHVYKMYLLDLKSAVEALKDFQIPFKSQKEFSKLSVIKIKIKIPLRQLKSLLSASVGEFL